MTKLKSLHLENLRKVSNFEGLNGIKNLKYLKIDGTLDWNQPIENFDFLKGLPNLEVFALGFITNKTKYPAFIALAKLKKLKNLKIGMATLETKEYAFLETILPNKCFNFGDNKWNPTYEISDQFIEFIGKGKRSLNVNNSKYEEKVNKFLKEYENYQDEAKQIIKNYCR